jgi:hypothetical protein
LAVVDCSSKAGQATRLFAGHREGGGQMMQAAQLRGQNGVKSARFHILHLSCFDKNNDNGDIKSCKTVASSSSDGKE